MRPRARCCAGAVLSLFAAALISVVSAQSHCIPTQKCWPSDTAVKSFISSLDKGAEVYLPYGDTSPMFYSLIIPAGNPLQLSMPGFAVYPSTEADVRRAVQFAHTYKIRVVGKCSGHDFNGRSTGYGVMQLNFKKFKSLAYNETDETLTFGSGCNHKDTYGHLASYGRVMVGGFYAYVCPAGCFSNGCYGPFTRQYGMGADTVVGMRYMLWNGTVLQLNATGKYKDLFGAVTAAGQSFGIILNIQVKTFPAPPAFIKILYTGTLYKSANATDTNLFREFLLNITWWRSLPLTLSYHLILMPSTGAIVVEFFYKGDNATLDLEDAQSPFRQLVDSDYTAAADVSSFASLAEFAVESVDPDAQYKARWMVGNVYVPPEQDKVDTVEQVWITALETGAPDAAFSAQFQYGGGSWTGMAPHVPSGIRTAMFAFIGAAIWTSPEDDLATATIFNETATPAILNLGSSSYQNHYAAWGKFNYYLDWKTRFYTDFAGLDKLKSKYDPCNLFVAKMGVGWDKKKATCAYKKK